MLVLPQNGRFHIKVLVVYSSDEVRHNRLNNRGKNVQKIIKRLMVTVIIAVAAGNAAHAQTYDFLLLEAS